MARYTESGLRHLVRQLLMEAANTQATVTVKNNMKTPIEIDGIYSAQDADQENDLSADFDEPRIVTAGQELAVNFTPTDNSSDFVVAIMRATGSGATPDYVRQGANFTFSLGNDGKGAVAVDTFLDAADEGDDKEMDPNDIKALARQAGEQFEIVEDPTDPEFVYAVYYTVTPTRAVVIRAPEEDYKGDKVVSSKGQEISPRRYGGSFRKVAQALVDKMKETHPAVEAPADAE